MISTVERRNQERGRVPFEIPVELAHDDFDDLFEADGVDLSTGGLALRTACLPDVGTELLCRFETVAGGTRVESRAQVVWTQLEGERSGHFGLRFLDVDAQTSALIDEMIAERAAHAERSSGRRDEVTVARLELDGVDSELTTRIARSGAGEAVFEQRLDLLELGRGVIARAGSALGHGSISGLSLRMDGDTPTLAVTVRFDGGKSLFGEFDWETQEIHEAHEGHEAHASSPPAPVSAAGRGTPDSDTVPDLDAPADTQQASHATVTVTEFVAQPLVTRAEDAPEAGVTCDGEEALPPALADAEAETACGLENGEDAAAIGSHDAGHAERDSELEADRAEPIDASAAPVVHAAPAGQPRITTAQPPAAYATLDDEAPRIVAPASAKVTIRSAQVSDEAEDSTHAAGDDWTYPLPNARSSVLVRFLRIIAAVTLTLQRGSTLLASVVWPKVQTALSVSYAALRERLISRLAPALATGVSAIARKTFARPRRTTAPAAHGASAQARALLRNAALAALAITAIALGIYALVPADDDIIPLHRSIEGLDAQGAQGASVAATQALAQPLAEGAQTPTAAQPSAAAPAAAAAGGSKVNPDYARAMLGAPSPAGDQSTTDTVPAVPTAGTVPSRSPYATDVRQARPATAQAVSATSYGHKAVPNAARFVLRMTTPVRSIQGNAHADGFTVIIPGSLSLDRAAPIRANHKAVAQAMVLNKGDRAELTIRFAAGKRPAYKVNARGSELEILIEQ